MKALPLTDEILTRPLPPHVKTSRGCWEIAAARDARGYVRICFKRGRTQRQVLAHRLFYWKLVGPIADGLQIDHLCRNPSCMNPEHMEAVTQAENVSRGIGVSVTNAKKVVCVRGHPLAPRTGQGRRKLCAECTRIRQRGYYHARARLAGATT